MIAATARRIATLALLAAAPDAGRTADAVVTTDAAGGVAIPATVLPPSSLLGAGTRAALRTARSWDASFDAAFAACGDPLRTDRAHLPDIRACQARALTDNPVYRDMRARYDARVETARIGGVATEVVTPARGIPVANRGRVLINLHGGGFVMGARSVSQLESIPIAATLGIRVVSVDYRLAPEARFPAATDDAVAVYRALLETYPPGAIGIYGCSAGGLLTAETVAALIARGLPPPGAIGLFCEGAAYWTEGDSGYFLTGKRPERSTENPYFAGIPERDPAAFPLFAPALLAKFPPALLLTGTRDFALSSATRTHAALVEHHVPAELHVWEGLGHSFMTNAALPESREAYGVVARFFDARLSRPAGPRRPPARR